MEKLNPKGKDCSDDHPLLPCAPSSYTNIYPCTFNSPQSPHTYLSLPISLRGGLFFDHLWSPNHPLNKTWYMGVPKQNLLNKWEKKINGGRRTWRCLRSMSPNSLIGKSLALHFLRGSQQGGSTGEGPCGQAWGPKFDPQDPQSERRELTPHVVF